jgi:hypothetical protein
MIKKKTNYEDWTDECEKLLAEWSEKASCYRWLHGRCEKSYQRWYYCFSIPVIVLSTLTGAANVGMDSFVSNDKKSMASAIVGGVNIFAGIISTLQNFLKVAELMEAHKIAGVSWGKLQRNIAIELALDPARRVIQSDFLKLSRAEYDRLIEAGPMIDDSIIFQFNKKFKNYEVSVPSICNGLDKCNIYKIDPDIKMIHDDFLEGIEDIVSDEEKSTTPREIIIKKTKEDPKSEKENVDKREILNKQPLNSELLNLKNDDNVKTSEDSDEDLLGNKQHLNKDVVNEEEDVNENIVNEEGDVNENIVNEEEDVNENIVNEEEDVNEEDDKNHQIKLIINVNENK